MIEAQELMLVEREVNNALDELFEKERKSIMSVDDFYFAERTKYNGMGGLGHERVNKIM